MDMERGDTLLTVVSREISVVELQQRKEEELERQNWSSPLEYYLSCIALAIGLGNVWRFPFVAYNNGGGAFLLPYLIAVAVVSRPLFFLESAVGQFSGKGIIQLWGDMLSLIHI